MATLRECALASVQGEVPDGQFTVATWDTLVPGVKEIGIGALVVGGAADAVPERATFCWEPGTPLVLSVRVTLAVRVPTASGTKVTWIAQDVEGARVAGEIGQLLVCAYSAELAPVSAMLEIVRPAVPVLETEMDCAALVVPITWLAKVRLSGFTAMTGFCKTTAVTVSEAVPVIAPEVAVIVTGPPAATPVARPALVMEAVPVADDVQVTLLVRFCVELSV
jgi:hypothetical protein